MILQPKYPHTGEQIVMHFATTPLPMLDIIDWHVCLMNEKHGAASLGPIKELWYDYKLGPAIYRELRQFNIQHRYGFFEWKGVVCIPMNCSKQSFFERPEISHLMYRGRDGAMYGI